MDVHFIRGGPGLDDMQALAMKIYVTKQKSYIKSGRSALDTINSEACE